MNQSHPETAYDPRKVGAQCDRCPLGPNPEARVLPELVEDEHGRPRTQWTPVKTHGAGREVYLIGAMPGPKEVDSGQPMDGPTGWQLNTALVTALNDLHAGEWADLPSPIKVGEPWRPVHQNNVRQFVATGNVCACPGPGPAKGAFERMRAVLQRENGKRKKQGLPLVPDPVEMCRPRMVAEMGRSKKLVLLGTEALQAVLGHQVVESQVTDSGKGSSSAGGRGSGKKKDAVSAAKKARVLPKRQRESLVITSKRGAMGRVTISTADVVASIEAATGAGIDGLLSFDWAATFHPAATIYSPGKLKPFMADMAKFYRFFYGRLKWVEPDILLHPELSRIDAFFDALEAAAETCADDAAGRPTLILPWDTETTGKEPLIAQMRCIGLGRQLDGERPVERCVCEPHWHPRLDMQRTEWLLIDKRFKNGICSICGRGHLDSDADHGPSMAATVEELALGVDSEGDEEEAQETQETHETSPLAADDPDEDSGAASEDAGEGVEGAPICVPAPRLTDYEVLLLYTPFSAPWLYPGGINDPAWLYIKQRLERVLADKRILKVGHNAGSYDRMITEASPWRSWRVGSEETKDETTGAVTGIRTKWYRKSESRSGALDNGWLSVTPEPQLETLIPTRFIAPDDEKGLGVIGPNKLDVRSWKEDHTGNKVALSKNLWELGVYCGGDVCVNGRLYPILMRESDEVGANLAYIPKVASLLEMEGEVYHGQQPSQERGTGHFVKAKRDVEEDGRCHVTPFEIDHRVQYMAVGIHRVGLYVDQQRVRLFSDLMHGQGRAHLAEFRKIAKENYGVAVDVAPAEEVPVDADPDTLVAQAEVLENDGEEAVSIGKEDENGGLNPNAANQLRELFYDKMRIPRPEFLERREMLTKTGALRVDDTVIRAFMADKRNSDSVKALLSELRAGKRKEFKIANGFLDPLMRPLADPGSVYPGSPRGYLWPDGCVRGSVNSTSNKTWRLNISNPNFAQVGSRKGGIVQELGPRLDSIFQDADDATRTFIADEMKRLMKVTREGRRDKATGEVREVHIARGKLKSVLGAYPGYMLVGGDMDQLHLRIIANHYKIPILLAAFLAGEDPHTTLAETLFGEKFTHDHSWQRIGGYTRKQLPSAKKALLSKDVINMREVAKTFRYAVIYWAHPDTAWRVVVATEDEHGELTNTAYTKDDIRKAHARWRLAEPQWETFYWDRMRELHKAHGKRVQSALSWHYSQFIADNEKSEIVNWPVLRAEADIARIAETRMMQAFPFGGSGAASASSFGGLPGQLFGRLGRYNPGQEVREGMCIQVHDFMAAQIRDLTGSRGTIWLKGAGKKGEDIEVDRWQNDMLETAKEALTFRIPGQDVTYSCEPGLSVRLDEV